MAIRVERGRSLVVTACSPMTAGKRATQKSTLIYTQQPVSRSQMTVDEQSKKANRVKVIV